MRLKNAYKNAKHGAQLYDPRTMEGHIVGMKKGGMADKSVTCSNCGWSWKSSEGGLNPLSCHKCGGVAKMQMGGLQKMPGGGTALGLGLEAATFVPGPVGMWASGASALNNLYEGDYLGAGLDALNIATGGTSKGLMAIARGAHAIRPFSNLALGAAKAARTVNKINKVVKPVTKVAGTVNEVFSSPNVQTERVPQRESTMLKPLAPVIMPKVKLKEGGKVDHSNDDDMVNGVASILRRVKDKKNRLQLANQLSNQFKREKVKYSLNDFLNKSKVKK